MGRGPRGCGRSVPRHWGRRGRGGRRRGWRGNGGAVEVELDVGPQGPPVRLVEFGVDADADHGAVGDGGSGVGEDLLVGDALSVLGAALHEDDVAVLGIGGVADRGHSLGWFRKGSAGDFW